MQRFDGRRSVGRESPRGLVSVVLRQQRFYRAYAIFTTRLYDARS